MENEFLKSSRVLCQGSSVGDRFEFIDAEYVTATESSTGCALPIVKMCSYGYRRVHADLNERSVQADPELVRALMRELGARNSSGDITNIGNMGGLDLSVQLADGVIFHSDPGQQLDAMATSRLS